MLKKTVTANINVKGLINSDEELKKIEAKLKKELKKLKGESNDIQK